MGHFTEMGVIMNMPIYRSITELDEALGFLSRHFEVARVVNPVITTVTRCDMEASERCFDVWNKTQRCRNCISSRVLMSGETAHKYERTGDGSIFLITSERIGTPDGAAVMELVSRMEHSFVECYADKQAELSHVEELNVMAYQDPLTGVFNRRYAEERVNANLSDASREDLTLYALMDIDNLKKTNDSYGHPIGDDLINLVVSQAVRTISFHGEDSGFLARIGGDEFFVMLHVPNRNVGIAVLDHIVTAIRASHVTTVPALPVSVSIGAVFSDEVDMASFEEVLSRVDERLYIAKNMKNNYVVSGDGVSFPPPPSVAGEQRRYRRDKTSISS